MTLEQLNHLDKASLREELARCCGARAWVEAMLSRFPFSSESALLKAATDTWNHCTEEDWKEAFTHHPKIGDIDSLKKKFASTAQWASGEQSGTSSASEETLNNLSKGNHLYEEKFGYIFIVCATGKSAPEMLEILNKRLPNQPADEIILAAAEQDKITQLRLKKLLS